MTTVLADAKLGVMVSDSFMTDDDRVWNIKKVHRIRGALVACAGTVAQYQRFIEWWRAGATEAPDFPFKDSSALVLDASGLYLFDESTMGLTKVQSGRESIGTGGAIAIAAYEAMGWKNPAKAVKLACKHSPTSRPPVRTYRL